MTRTRMTLSLLCVLSLFLLATLAGCATLPSASVKTNVPSDRLSSETYTSPDGGYRVTLPHLNAGVTASQGQSEDALFDEAKRNLDGFIKGLSIK